MANSFLRLALTTLLCVASGRRQQAPPGAALLEASRSGFAPQHALETLMGARAPDPPPMPPPVLPGAARAARPRARLAAQLGDGEYDDLGAGSFPRSYQGEKPGVVSVTAHAERGAEGWHSVLLPRAWAEKLEPSSIAISFVDSELVYFTGRARLASIPSRSVAFAAMPTGHAATAREIAMAKLLGSTGFAPQLIESAEFSDVTYALMESPGDQPLGALIPRMGQPPLPLDRALALMVDLLGSLKVLERVGIVHGDLTEQHIYIVDGGEHALLTDFRTSCIASGDDEELGCIVDGGGVMGSAFHQAPEMDERPSVASNVWQLGLVFAQVLMGEEASTASQIRSLFPFKKLDDTTQAGRRHIREMVRDIFSLQQTKGYRELQENCDDVLEVVDGMLEKNPDKRWSAAEALEAMQRVALRRGVSLPPPREPSAAVDDWHLSWQ